MATVVYMGAISPEGEHILRTYLNHFMPDTEILTLKPVGVRGTMKNKVSRPDTVLAILDDSLYSQCEGFCDDVLSLPKVYLYQNDDDFKTFLIKWFGRLEDSEFGTTETIESSSSYSIIDDDLNFGSSAPKSAMQNSVSDEELREKENEIESLKVKLSQSELMVHNLELQLKERKGSTDVSVFVSKIHELEAELEKKSTEIQTLSSSASDTSATLIEIENLKREVRSYKDNCASLEHDLKVANDEKSDLTAQIETLNGDIVTLNDKISMITDELSLSQNTSADSDALVEELQTKISELQKKCNELQTANEDTSELQAKIDELQSVQTELSACKVDLEDKESKLLNLQTDLDSKSRRCETLSNNIKELNEMLSEKENEVSEQQAKLLEMTTENAELNQQITSLQAKVDSLSAQIDTLSATITEQEDTIANQTTVIAEQKSSISALKELNSENEATYNEQLTELENTASAINDREEEIAQLQNTISDLKSTITRLNSNIEDIRLELETKEGMISAYTQKEALFKEASDRNNEALKKALSDNTDLINKVQDLEDAKSNLEDELAKVMQQTEDDKRVAEQILNNKINELELANSRIEQLEGSLTTLKADVVESKADSSTIEQLNSELTAEKRKVARLTAELDVYKSGVSIAPVTLEAPTVSSELVNKLKAEISKLNEQIATLKKEKEEAPDTDSLLKEIEDLKIDLLTNQETLDELENGIFGQLANIAMPRVAYDIRLNVPDRLSSKFVVVASGSAESNIYVYQQLKKTCQFNSKTSYLIVDLVTDSNIDVAFGAKQLNSPLKWLTGQESFKNYVSTTSLPNVRVISTALSYLNDLSLLSIDWSLRLAELQNYADVVILNVGCLNNLVSKLLYGSFSQIMLGHIILKATPVNIRTAILVLTGFKSLKNSVVNCLGFDMKASKMMYQKLVEKCQAQIMQDADIIQL